MNNSATNNPPSRRLRRTGKDVLFLMPDKLETHDDVLRWAIAHDATNRQRWAEQRRWNEEERRRREAADARLEAGLEKQGGRISVVENRLIWFAAAAAGAGGVAGQLIPSLFGGA